MRTVIACTAALIADLVIYYKNQGKLLPYFVKATIVNTVIFYMELYTR